MSRCCTHVSRHFRRVSAAGTYVQVESWANRLHVARIGSCSGWPPLRCVRTASPTSRTIVVIIQGKAVARHGKQRRQNTTKTARGSSGTRRGAGIVKFIRPLPPPASCLRLRRLNYKQNLVEATASFAST